MKIIIKDEFKDDWVTRVAGERLRHRILEILKKENSIELDFTGKMIASTSFFDEGIAKLRFEGMSVQDIDHKINFIGLHPRDKAIMDDMIKKRSTLPPSLP